MTKSEAIRYMIDLLDGAWPVQSDPLINGEHVELPAPPDGWSWVRTDKWVLKRDRLFMSAEIIGRNEYMAAWFDHCGLNRPFNRQEALEFVRCNVTRWPTVATIKSMPECTGWWWMRGGGRFVLMGEQGYAPIIETEWKK